MVQINFALKEVNCKVVFYGPGMSGKTTNLEIVHQKAPEENKGELTSISTDGDRTLFFDFMPLDLGNVAGMRTKFQLYTVPGQVYYNSTRKLVLQGVDGIIFVADSDPDKMDENVESYSNLIENLAEYGKDIRELPHVIQYNKRDLPNALPVAEIDKIMNKFGVPTFEAVAYTGEGVFPTLKTLAAMVLESIEKIDGRNPRRSAAKPASVQPVAAPQPAPARAPVRAPARAPAKTSASSRPVAARAPGAQGRPQKRVRGTRQAVAAQGAPRKRRASVPGQGNRQGTRPINPRRRAAATPKKKGFGLAIALTVTFLVAAAGVAYLFLGNPSFNAIKG